MPKQLLALFASILFLASAGWGTVEAKVTTENVAARQIIGLHLPDRAFENAIAPTLQQIRDDIEASEQMRALEKKFPGARKARADALVAATSAMYKKKFDQAIGEIIVEFSGRFSQTSLNQALHFYQKPHVAEFLSLIRNQRPCQTLGVAECHQQGAMEATDFFSKAPKHVKEEWAAFLASDAGNVDAFLENLLGMLLDRFARMPVTPAESEALEKIDRDTLRKIQS